MSAIRDSQRGRPVSPPGQRALVIGKRLGLVAFLFFLVKGLLWLTVPAVLAAWAAL